MLKRETIAITESVTSGMMQAALSQVIDAAHFYQGGITTYNLGQKCKHLGIDPLHAASCLCVSGRIAEEMALAACRLFNSDWGTGITGYATPVLESGNELFAYYAIAYRGRIMRQEYIGSQKHDPLEVRRFYVNTLLDELQAQLVKL